MLKKTAIALPLALILGVGVPAAFPAPASAAVQSTNTAAVNTLLTDINAARANDGLPALTLDPNLANVAQGSAQSSATNGKATFDSTAVSKIPTGYKTYGQLYASGYSPAKLTAAWMTSENSKAQLLSVSHNKIGIGVAYDSAQKPYYTVIVAGYPTAEQIAKAEVEVSKPTNIVATAVNANRIDLTWSPVTYKGVLAPYKVISTSASGVTNTYYTTDTKYSLTGLQPSTNYSITIEAKATSKDGVNTRVISGNTVKATPAGSAPTTPPPTSTPSPTPTTPTPNPTPTVSPSAVQVSPPQAVKSLKKSYTTMTVGWTKPATVVGKISKYTVTVTGTNYSKTFTTSGTATSQAVTGLKENTPYTVAVTAHAVSADGKNTRSAKYTTTISTVKTLTQADVDRIIADTNAYRKAAGVAPLKQNTAINSVAAAWSKVQADEQLRYHNPNSSKQIPSGWLSTGENVANGFTVETVTKAWYDSPGHRANMLNPKFTDIGVGLAYDSNGVLYYTQNFAQYK